MQQLPVRVVKADPCQSEAVLRMIRQSYFEKYNAMPKDLLEFCFVAVRGEEIIGSIGLEFSAATGFEIEKYFDCDFKVLPYAKNFTANFGRWKSPCPEVGSRLLFAAVKYAIAHGKLQGVASSTPFLIRNLKQKYGLKLKIHDFSRKQTQCKQTQKEELNFFSPMTETKFYSFNLQEWYDTLEVRV